LPAAPPVLGVPGVPRNPKRVAWLSLATLGIYGIVWFYRFGREVDAAGRFGINPKRYYKQMGLVAAFIVTLPVALIHFFVYAHRVSKSLDELSARVGAPTELEDRFPILIIPFGGVVFLAMLQKAANEVWQKMGSPRTPPSGSSPTAAAKGPSS
jgi:uncharacterized protein DUF4234